MFTGIIQTVGQVHSLSGLRLRLEALLGDDLALGESIAVNGVCLTLVGDGAHLEFDLSEETLRRSSLGSLSSGALVNLERAMRADDRFGGHIVQGHVDTIAEVISVEEYEGSQEWRFALREGDDRYLIDKGSVTVDGVSLTVVHPHGNQFSVALIPHTLAHTNLRERKLEDWVNIEFDLMAKYAEKLLGARKDQS